jgi:hypothetical protein
MSLQANIDDAPNDVQVADAAPTPANPPINDVSPPREVGGRGGLDPTRYGDWEMRGRCVDF